MTQAQFQTGTDFRKIIDATPLVSVDLLIHNNSGEVLLGKRVNRPAQGYWFVPGGRIVKNETISQAIRRVSKTEVGIELNKQNGKLIGVYDHIYDDNYWGDSDVNTHYVVLAFSFFDCSAKTICINDQHEAFKWWAIDTLLKNTNVHSNTKAYFSDFDK